MIFFLTYHRISPDERTRGDFYTVSSQALEAHLRLAREHGLTPLSIDDLIAGRAKDGSLLLSFDDGTTDHFERARPVLERHGMRGIFFFPTIKLNKPGHLTHEQVRALAASGHVFGCHGHNHRRMDTLPDDLIDAQIETSKKVIRDLTGCEMKIFAPPGGYLNDRLRRHATARGIVAIRTMQWGLNRTLRLDDIECIPVSSYITESRFKKIIEGRDVSWLRGMYAGKQLLKSLIPARGYQLLRDALFSKRKN